MQARVVAERVTASAEEPDEVAAEGSSPDVSLCLILTDVGLQPVTVSDARRARALYDSESEGKGMATDVDICNGALSLLGARAQVTCIRPPTAVPRPATARASFRWLAKELIEGGAWAFAKRRVALAEVDNASNIWQYAYAIPSNMVNALRVVQQRYLIAAGLAWPLVYEPQGLTNWTLVDEMFNERGSAQFTIENGVLYTNRPDAVLLYTVDVTDAASFRPCSARP